MGCAPSEMRPRLFVHTPYVIWMPIYARLRARKYEMLRDSGLDNTVSKYVRNCLVVMALWSSDALVTGVDRTGKLPIENGEGDDDT
jgi:hypothetical protein